MLHAQLQHLVRDEGVADSNPATPTNHLAPSETSIPTVSPTDARRWSGYCRRQLLANAAIAAWRVGSQPCVGSPNRAPAGVRLPSPRRPGEAPWRAVGDAAAVPSGRHRLLQGGRSWNVLFGGDGWRAAGKGVRDAADQL